ncbi:MAG: HipA N-terminal domain-containing protein [Lachnospiraceae bacterium]|nr:HipA N-terminal domain-containing protein [Lachnospiraceae bacterium]
MNSELRKAKIFVQSRHAGILCETDEGYTFTYDRDYLAGENALAVSLTLPQPVPYRFRRL